MKRLATSALASMALLSAPASVEAAQRFAAPTGSGEACTAESRCSLETAVEKAGAGDEVIVGPGTYSTTGTIASPELSGVSIHGEAAAAMPVVEAKVAGWALEMRGIGGSLSYIEVDNRGFSDTAAITCSGGWVVERVKALATGPENTTGILPFENCQVRNSLARAEGENAAAVYSAAEGSASLSNVTALASGPESVGIVSRRLGGAGSRTLTIRNTIADGGAGDLWATSFSGEDGLISVFNSNFDSLKPGSDLYVTNAGGNQTAAPLFVDAAGGNFAEAPGSPTIGAGAVGGDLGPLDLAGNPRTIDGIVDIGAYEFVPTQPAAGRLLALEVAPAKFRSISVGGSTGGGVLKSKPPVRTGVTFELSAAARVAFSVERRLKGRKVGAKCVKQKPANRSRKGCARFVRVKGSFSVDGNSGFDSFTFTGKVGGRALRAGRYRLVGRAGGATKRSPFRIAGVFRPAPK